MDAVAMQPGLLVWHQKLFYSFGHIQNDLCATMWFTLLLVFFQDVVRISEKPAGYLLMWGQVVDAVCTPLVGYESDRMNGCCGLGKRKSWHLLGTLAVSISFPLIFLRCFACTSDDMWGHLSYYAPFIAIFQFGWASTQISHMALMSQLTQDKSQQTELSGLRNAGTLLSRVIVFCVGWGFFGADASTQVTPEDKQNFMLLMITVTGLGVVCSAAFLVGLREVESNVEHTVVTAVHRKSMEWHDWLKEHQFYLIALLYMLSRLIVNVSGTYWPFYVTKTLDLDKKFIVIVPLIVNVTGFIVSLLMRPVSDRIGKKLSVVLGIVFTVCGCLWLWLITLYNTAHLQVIGPAILIGIGGSVLIVASLAMGTELIGRHAHSGAFVFGSLSFCDKLAGGAAILIIQLLCPCAMGADKAAVADYYRTIMVYVLVGFCLTQFVVLLVTWPQKLGELRKQFDVPESNNSSYNSETDNDERSPLLRNSINRASNYLSVDADMSEACDMVGEAATRPTPNVV